MKKDKEKNPTHLLLEPEPLLERIVQLRVGVAELLAAHEPLEALAEPGARAVPFSKGRHYLWVADCVRGLGVRRVGRGWRGTYR